MDYYNHNNFDRLSSLDQQIGEKLWIISGLEIKAFDDSQKCSMQDRVKKLKLSYKTSKLEKEIFWATQIGYFEIVYVKKVKSLSKNLVNGRALI